MKIGIRICHHESSGIKMYWVVLELLDAKAAESVLELHTGIISLIPRDHYPFLCF